MFIKDFTADVSTFNFGTEKDTKAIHEALHAKGIVTIGELCHLSKKNLETLEIDPAIIELHLKKNGLSLGMSDNDIFQHQLIVSKLITANSDITPSNKSADDSHTMEFVTSMYKLDADWSERYFELAKGLFFSDHCVFRSKKKKMKRALLLASQFIVQYYCVSAKLLEIQKEK